MTDYSVRKATEDDESVVFESVIRPHIRWPDEYSLSFTQDKHAYVVEHENHIVSVMVATEVEVSNFTSECTYFDGDISTYMRPFGSHIGFVHTAYTKPEYTNMGCGSVLLSVIEDVLRLNGVRTTVAEVWQHGGEDSPERLFVSNSYELLPIRQSDKLKTVQSEETCKKCGDECECSVCLAVKTL